MVGERRDGFVVHGRSRHPARVLGVGQSVCSAMCSFVPRSSPNAKPSRRCRCVPLWATPATAKRTGQPGHDRITARADCGKPSICVGQGGAIVALATILPRDGGDTELDGLFVEPSIWRRGIGRLLVEHCAEVARSGGSTALHVIGNPHAERFYLACGLGWLELPKRALVSACCCKSACKISPVLARTPHRVRFLCTPGPTAALDAKQPSVPPQRGRSLPESEIPMSANALLIPEHAARWRMSLRLCCGSADSSCRSRFRS